MKKNILFAILLFATVNLSAQNFIKGRVISSNDNSFIIGANVFWKGTNNIVTTDNNGKYVISEPEDYPATLTVSFVGFKQQDKVISELKSYSFILDRLDALDEVNINSKNETTKFSVIDSKNIQTLTLGELEKAACCNLSECFTTNNTVDVVYSDAVSGAKKIMILGLDGVYTQITQENIPIIRGISSSYGINYIPGAWIESIQIIKGSGSVVNGFESLTGQINLEYFKPETCPRLYWNSYLNNDGKVENNLLLSKKNGKWKSNLFVHHSILNNEIDHNGQFHDHTDHTNHKGDNFMDMPKFNQINIFNRWSNNGNQKYNMTITARGLIEERNGGTISGFSNPYIVNVKNNLLEITTKNGFLQPTKEGKSIGIQTLMKRHDLNTQFGQNIYEGSQESIMINLIRQSYIRNIDNTFKYGFSYFADRNSIVFTGNTDSLLGTNTIDLSSTDLISGVFSEYTHNIGENTQIVSGIRADYYNKNSSFIYSPSLNVKYNPTTQSALRFTYGKSFRLANIFSENLAYLASSRKIGVVGNIQPEIAWNLGLNYTYCFFILEREGTFNIDYYKTTFENQVIVDIEDQSSLTFYNLDGKSIAHSTQFDLTYEILNRFDIQLSYKLNNIKKTFGNEEKLAPLVPQSRALLNFAYVTKSDKWQFSFTTSYVGKMRVPIHNKLSAHNQLDSENYSKPFYTHNTQLTNSLKYFDIYFGCENLLSYTQENPVIDAYNPESKDFDASMIWGPINHRMFYLGLRYKLK